MEMDRPAAESEDWLRKDSTANLCRKTKTVHVQLLANLLRAY